MPKHTTFPGMPPGMEKLVNKFVDRVYDSTAQKNMEGKDLAADDLPKHFMECACSVFGAEYDTQLEPGYGYKNFPHRSASAAPDCTENCNTCSRQYRSLELQKWPGLAYAETCSDNEAQQRVEQLIKATESSLAHVRARLELHGNAVIKRWRKRTPSSRATFLLAAKPNIYKHRWVEAELLYQRFGTIEQSAKHHKLWLLPHLDLPALSESPDYVLSLLHARTAYTPSQWVAFDNEQLHIAFEEGSLALVYNPHCVVMHNEEGTFGKLVPWEKGAAHRWDIISFSRALVVLEAQADLAASLKAIVDILLQAPAAEGDGEWRVCAAKGFMNREYSVTGPWIDQFFIAPPNTDLTKVVAALRDRLQAAKDDLFLMQADPIYARDFVLWSQQMPYHTSLGKDQREADSIRLLAMHCHAVECWRLVVDEAEHALNISRKYSDSLHAGIDLPPELEEALYILQHFLEQEYLQIAQGLELNAGTITMEKKHGGLEPEYTKLRKDPLLWAFGRLQPPTGKCVANSTAILRMIEHHIFKLKPRERPNLERLVMKYLHDIGAVDQALSLLRFQRPYLGRHLPRAEIDRLLTRRPLQGERMRRVERESKADLQTFDALFTPLQRLLATANHARLTSRSSADLRAAHVALADYWKAFRRRQRKVCKAMDLSKEGIDEVISLISYDKSAGHKSKVDEACKALEVAYTKQEADRKARQGRTKSKPHAIATDPAPELRMDQRRMSLPNVERLSLAEPKQKVKTRCKDSATDVSGIEAAAQEETEEEAKQQPRIEVGAASLALLQRMFTPIACSKATADIKWNDFQLAVVDAGCTYKFGGGSSVTYMYRGVTGVGNVMIHRPHPDPTVDPIMLGSFGKKFGAKMGWNKDTFVLRKKGSEGAEGQKGITGKE